MVHHIHLRSHPEYKGGYAPIHEAILLEVIAESQAKRAGFKTFARVFAAMCEKKALPEKSKVDLYRIINCKAGSKGCRRISQSEIDRVSARVREVAKAAKRSPVRRRRPVSRQVLQAIAQGGLSASESLVLFFYASRRITQSKAMKRLNESERYGRFKYSELQELTGIERARIGEAVSKLREKGLLHVVEVHQSNVNAYGLCFVDGWLISLFRTMQECVRRVVQSVVSALRKTATPPAKKSTPSTHKTAGLINKNIKTSIKENKNSFSEKRETWTETLARLKQRCELMEASSIGQTA